MFDQFLVYATGGWADAPIGAVGMNLATGISGGRKQWASGYVYGAGVDYRVSTNWIVGAELVNYKFNFDRSNLNSAAISTVMERQGLGSIRKLMCLHSLFMLAIFSHYEAGLE